MIVLAHILESWIFFDFFRQCLAHVTLGERESGIQVAQLYENLLVLFALLGPSVGREPIDNQ